MFKMQAVGSFHLVPTGSIIATCPINCNNPIFFRSLSVSLLVILWKRANGSILISLYLLFGWSAIRVTDANKDMRRVIYRNPPTCMSELSKWRELPVILVLNIKLEVMERLLYIIDTQIYLWRKIVSFGPLRHWHGRFVHLFCNKLITCNYGF